MGLGDVARTFLEGIQHFDAGALRESLAMADPSPGFDAR